MIVFLVVVLILVIGFTYAALKEKSVEIEHLTEKLKTAQQINKELSDLIKEESRRVTKRVDKLLK